MPRNKKKKKHAVPEAPEETADLMTGYVSDEYVVLLGVDPSSQITDPKALILPIEMITYILLREERGAVYIYRVGITDGFTLEIHNKQDPIDLGEMIFPAELPDVDEDPWKPRGSQSHSRSRTSRR